MTEQPLTTVLLVEDDPRLARFTAEYLHKHRCVTTVLGDGRLGLEAALQHRFDVVLLDLMLPSLGGLEICRELRQRSDVPIIILTARGEEADRVMGLELGADDYLVKPFSPRELLARISALLRRARGQAGPAQQGIVQVGALLIDGSAHRATLSGQELALTSYEFTLLQVLAERAGRALSREQLMALALGNAEESFDRSIDVHISRLRAKIEADPRHPRYIKTIRGLGYMMVKEGHSSEGHSRAGHSSDGHSRAGHSSEGHSSDGHSRAGHSSDGHSRAGHSSEGHSSDGHSRAGHSSEGQS